VKTIGDALKFAQSRIDRIDAQMLVAHALGRSRASVIANADRKLDAEHALVIELQIAARERGVPVAQIVGSREFYGRMFHINEHVLIPRPETEILIEQALACISKQKCPKLPANRPLSILDLGTGSGAIGITLALELPNADVTAVDRSTSALALAQRNAQALNARVNFIDSDWFSALDNTSAHQRYDLIVSNPPYVARHDKHLQEGDLRFEPRMALTDESDDGLDAIRLIVAKAPSYLHEGGWLMFEHGYDQGVAARQLLEQRSFVNVSTANDLAAIPRVSIGQRA
jgi:release factor glutamine methyltransferase